MSESSQSSSRTIWLVVILIILLVLLLLWLRGCAATPEGQAPDVPESRQTSGAGAVEGPAGVIAVQTSARHVVKVYTPADDGDEWVVVEDGYSDIPLTVPPGNYIVKIEVADKELVLGTFAVRSGKTTKVPFNGFGTLQVTCPVFDAPYEVLQEDGTVVTEGGAGTYPVAVPVGQHQVRMRVGALELLKSVEVRDGETSTVAINDFGLLHVKCMVFDHDYTVANAEGKVVAEGAAGVSEVPLLPGTYNVRIVFSGEALVVPVTVVAGKKNTLEVKGHGTLFVKAPEFDTDYTVQDAAGEQVARGASGVDKVPLVNGTYTITCQGKTHPVTIKGSAATVEFK